jgi:hypothetical protein
MSYSASKVVIKVVSLVVDNPHEYWLSTKSAFLSVFFNVDALRGSRLIIKRQSDLQPYKLIKY